MHLFGVQSYDFFRIFSRFAPFFFVRRRKSVATSCATRQKRSRCGSRYLALRFTASCAAIHDILRCNPRHLALRFMASCTAIHGVLHGNSWSFANASVFSVPHWWRSVLLQTFSCAPLVRGVLLGSSLPWTGKAAKPLPAWQTGECREPPRLTGRPPAAAQAPCGHPATWLPSMEDVSLGSSFPDWRQGWPGHPIPASAARCGTSCPCPPPSFSPISARGGIPPRYASPDSAQAPTPASSS